MMVVIMPFRLATVHRWMQNHPKNAMNTAVPHSLAKIFTIVFCFCSIRFLPNSI